MNTNRTHTLTHSYVSLAIRPSIYQVRWFFSSLFNICNQFEREWEKKQTIYNKIQRDSMSAHRHTIYTLLDALLLWPPSSFLFPKEKKRRQKPAPKKMNVNDNNEKLDNVSYQFNTQNQYLKLKIKRMETRTNRWEPTKEEKEVEEIKRGKNS